MLARSSRTTPLLPSTDFRTPKNRLVHADEKTSRVHHLGRSSLPPLSGITEHELLQSLIARLDGSQAKEALGDDWQGWWPDDEDGGGEDSPLPQPLPEPA